MSVGRGSEGLCLKCHARLCTLPSLSLPPAFAVHQGAKPETQASPSTSLPWQQGRHTTCPHSPSPSPLLHLPGHGSLLIHHPASLTSLKATVHTAVHGFFLKIHIRETPSPKPLKDFPSRLEQNPDHGFGTMRPRGPRSCLAPLLQDSGPPALSHAHTWRPQVLRRAQAGFFPPQGGGRSCFQECVICTHLCTADASHPTASRPNGTLGKAFPESSS